MADLGVLAIGDVNNSSSGVAAVGSNPLLEVIASADDADYAYNNSNATGTTWVRLFLADTPSDFGNMDTLSVRLRYQVEAGSPLNTWDALTARIFQSDGTTPLTDLATLATSITTTTATNSGVVAFTGVNTSVDKSFWDGAIIEIAWNITRNKGGDTLQRRVTAGELTGTYTLAAPPPADVANACMMMGVGV